ncbi:MAG: hypothetical protein V1913_17135 [Fibrobacterota bacterium]
MKHLLFILCLVPSLSAASAQENYPWGHQLLSLHCRLVPAGPLPEAWRLYVGAEYIHEASLPVYGVQRTLVKPALFGFYYRSSEGTLCIDGAWEALYHSEAGHAFAWDPGDLRLYTTVNLLKTAPLLSLRFGTKLPNAPNNFPRDQLPLNGGLSGAGTDNTDFALYLLLSQPFGPFVVDGNCGLLILGSPTGYSEQLDVYYTAAGIRYAWGGFLAGLETDLSFGPRRFDDAREVAVRLEYVFNGFFIGLRQGFGLNASTDDIQSRLYIGRKSGRP